MRGVYAIRNILNGKLYIGRAEDIDKRFDRHRKDLNGNNHHCLHLQRAWNKYGDNNFEFIVLEFTGSLQDSIDREQYYLDQYIGARYNINPSSTGGDILSSHPDKEAIVAKMRKSLIKRYSNMTQEEKNNVYGNRGMANGMYGKTHSEENRQKFSIAHKGNTYRLGKKQSAEARKKMSQIASQRTGAKNPFYGRSHTDETRKKISETRKSQGLTPPNARKVVINEIEYPSATFAAKELGCVTATILNRVNSKSKKFAGYSWKDE